MNRGLSLPLLVFASRNPETRAISSSCLYDYALNADLTQSAIVSVQSPIDEFGKTEHSPRSRAAACFAHRLRVNMVLKGRRPALACTWNSRPPKHTFCCSAAQ